MSLFGESSPSTRSLFAAHDCSGAPSLFDDDDDTVYSTGGWGSSVGPAADPSVRRNRSQNLGDVMRSLLTADNADIPAVYYAVYGKLVSEFGDGADGMVDAHGAADKVLDEAGVAGDERNRIWDTVVGRKDLVGRGEVWCLLAMVGLWQ